MQSHPANQSLFASLCLAILSLGKNWPSFCGPKQGYLSLNHFRKSFQTFFFHHRRAKLLKFFRKTSLWSVLSKPLILSSHKSSGISALSALVATSILLFLCSTSYCWQSGPIVQLDAGSHSVKWIWLHLSFHSSFFSDGKYASKNAMQHFMGRANTSCINLLFGFHSSWRSTNLAGQDIWEILSPWDAIYTIMWEKTH